MTQKKFADEAELDAWYEEQKRLLLEKLESTKGAKDAEASYKAQLTTLMQGYTEMKTSMIDEQLQTYKKSLASKTRNKKKK
ncbi:hypothetical protein HY640_03340 [Candidatus Woesearchaeota archaeon]|nr:hypothetical protein [Candidatus Woesearchaeota archaeon]